MKSNKNFEIRSEEIEKLLTDIGHVLAKTLPEGWGFALQIFNFGEGGATFYISNAQRKDMVKALQEFIDKQELEDD